MKIYGLQKLTLVDYPGYSAAIIFTGGCNFRCPFCHNAGLVEKEYPELSIEEVMAYLTKRKGLLDAVVISGGEPTLQNDLVSFVSTLKEMGYKIKLDTNGTNPTMLKQLLEKQLLDYVAMDIKNSFEEYSVTAGITNKAVIDNIKESLRVLKESGVDYELRTTLVAGLHSAESITQMASDIKGAKKLFLQHFVDNGGCIKGGLGDISKLEAEEFKQIFENHNIETKLRGY